jgi:hypothetical protein
MLLYIVLIGRMIVNDEGGGMWKEIVMAYCNALIQHMSGVSEEYHEISHDVWLPD